MKLYDKRDDFNFPIVNFPFTFVYVATFQQHLHMEYISLSWSNIPELVVPIGISLIERGLLLTRKLLKQRFLLVKLKLSLRKIYGCHHELGKHYRISVSQMTTIMFHLLLALPSLMTCHRVYNLSNTIGTTSGARTDYPSGAPEFIPGF